MSSENKKQNTIPRSPVVVVMGHIDHGKSSILDYIRKANIVAKEAGGITQHIGAYEAEVKCGDEHHHKTVKLTFLDTPGHEAFSQMRTRGAKVADVAVLVVASDDGPKPQTMEAYEAIKKADVPFVVVLNKIDKPGAEPERVKNQLAEKQIFVEGYGGDIPSVSVSAKTGEGINELLDVILLLAEMENLTGDSGEPASGVVVESHMDPKRGITATLLIQNGTMHRGMFIVSGAAMAPVRIFENFQGKIIEEASFSSPVIITGFDKMPDVGAIFMCFDSKSEAEKSVGSVAIKSAGREKLTKSSGGKLAVDIVLKSDVAGSLEALENEIKKLEKVDVAINTIRGGVGKINENDVKIISGSNQPIILGFNVEVEDSAKTFAERFGVEIFTSDIIYRISEWLEKNIEVRKKTDPENEIIGLVKILKTFSSTKNKKVIGGKVVFGKAIINGRIVVKRDGVEVGRGKVGAVRKNKEEVKEVGEGEELGLMLEIGAEVKVGDEVEILRKSS